MPRIYTRTGDRGETGLFDGTRTRKCNDRVDLYGNVDELNSCLGTAVAALPDGADLLQQDLERIQTDLFELGAVLADPPRSEALTADETGLPLDGAALEPMIDRLEAPLPELRAFILPGGHPGAAALHVARTVCRRVERQAVALRDDGVAIPLGVIVYLNRLSDLLFIAARHANHLAGRDDVLWSGRRADPPTE
ncbi:cob(I)yrinic acid a,c-diamide adenosyltransferase [bacterium]|nr:cob(I)yrinic acid a,c-diamide adenosyltransferase [bacterium]